MITWFFRFCFQLLQSCTHVNDGVVNAIGRNGNVLILPYGALLVPYTRAYSFILRMYTFLPLAQLFSVWRDFFLSGATFFCLARLFFVWRDFFLSGATFFCLTRLFFVWRDFFFWRDFFLSGATFFCLARLFLFGATFFVWRDFFRWVLSVRLLKCIIIQI